MICTQCGAYADAGTKYCPVCGAPLPKKDAAAYTPEAGEAAQNTSQREWGFVPSPKWPTPTFDINDVEALPEEMFTPGPASPSSSTGMPQYEQRTGGVRRMQQPYPDGDIKEAPFSPQPITPPQYTPDNVSPYASVGGFEAEPTGYQNEFGRAPQRASVYSMDDEDDRQFAVPERKNTAPVLSQQSASRKAKPASRSRSHTAPKRGRANNPLLFFGIVGVLVVLLIVFGVILINKNYGSIGGFFSTIFGGSPILKKADMHEGKDIDTNVDCYIVTVYARPGSTVTMRLKNPETLEVMERQGTMPSSKEMPLYFPKSMFLPAEPIDGTTFEMTPDVTITTESGDVYPLELDPITVNIPTFQLNLTTPEGGSANVSRNVFTIAGNVDAANVTLTVEGQPLAVDESGNFSGEYTLPDLGVHTLTVEARKNGYQIMRKTIEVTFMQSEAEITLEGGSIRANAEGLATVKGKTDAGATMRITGPSGVTLGTPSVNASTGEFSFTAQMPAAGGYELSCTVTKDGLDTTIPIFVEYAPVYDTYTASVHKMDYSRMLNETLHTASYRCVGTVTEVLTTEPYIIAKLSTSSGDLLFEYHNNAASVEANDGKNYNLYADYKGIDEESGLPLVYAWYILKPSR